MAWEKKTKVLFNPLAEVTQIEKVNIKISKDILLMFWDGLSTTSHQLPPNESSANENQR